MNLSVGIVGLPNAGKSTLFNALASRRLAKIAPRPFTTIDPNKATVTVPDERVVGLAELIKPEVVVFASILFIDIAGLIKNAHKGDGLGNEFLSKIKDVDLIVHVVRAFRDPQVSHQHPSFIPGSVEQVLEDIEIVNLELELGGITDKPVIYVLNVSERDLENKEYIMAVKEKFGFLPLLISAKLEEELIDFPPLERKKYLESIGAKKSGLEKLITLSYKMLNLISFYTIKGGREVHAWSIKEGSTYFEAAGKIHSDFQKYFIKAEAIDADKLLTLGKNLTVENKSKIWKIAKEKGLIKTCSKNDVIGKKEVIEIFFARR